MMFPINPNTGVPHLPEYVTRGFCSSIGAYGSRRVWTWKWVEGPVQELCSYCVSRLAWRFEQLLDAYAETGEPIDPRILSRFTIK